jgi:transcription termination factor NusB
MAENDRLNPQITKIDIGTRNLRSITLYPMSLADEKLFGDVIQKALQKYFEQQISESEEELVGFVDFLIKLIEKNLIKILGLITDEEKPKQVFDEMTNFQLSELVKTIYEVNFEQPSKNVKSLLDKLKTMFLSRRLSQPSLSDTLSTTSPISTPEASGMEDLPEDSS